MSEPKKTDADLAEVFDLAVDWMHKTLTEGEEVIVKTKDGARIETIRASASAVNVITQFLHRQGITATRAHKGLQKVEKAIAEFPFDPDEEVAASGRPTLN